MTLTMMDTNILFDNGRFKSDFDDNSSIMVNDSAYSSSDGTELSNFDTDLWNGYNDDFQNMLDQIENHDVKNEPLDIPVKQETQINVTENNFLSLENLESEIKDVVNNQDPIDSFTHLGVGHIKKLMPAIEDFNAMSFLDFGNCPSSRFEDLPPNLDLCSFIDGDDIVDPKTEPLESKVLDLPKPTVLEKKEHNFKAGIGRKKIDMNAMKYIVSNESDEDENIDVETISEHENTMVLEAADVDSLLEQFEATEVTEQKVNSSEDESKKANSKKKSDKKKKLNKKDSQETLTSSKNKIVSNCHNQKESISKDTKQKFPAKNNLPSKKNIDELPEIINRLKETTKRKSIALIDPVPNNSIKKKKLDGKTPPRVVETKDKKNTDCWDLIKLDHDYCSPNFLSSQDSTQTKKKDSGYFSEEEKGLHKQPIVKTADGKFMVSLLKVNTIKSNLEQEEKQKKKLNIEEYKKRRLGVLNTSVSSKPTSPSSTCSSPIPEDEHTRRIKHEEKLKKMAQELLNTKPKSCTDIKTEENEKQINESVVVPKRAKPVSIDMDVKTFVSMGVNTDISGDKLLPAEKLEEIKPLLENASVKINSNSLINSLIENIPNLIKPEKTVRVEKVQEHGEDKTIIYLPKNRKLPKCTDAEVQTSITLVGNNKRRYRRRSSDSSSSISSCSTTSSNSMRSRSPSSRYSRSSPRSVSLSSSCSRSSSRSGSPYRSKHNPKQKKRKREYVQEVEERRVIYVGKLNKNTTKEDLHKRFARFGPIKSISLHFRQAGDNYGFVTFQNQKDAYKAIEHANDDPYEVHYDVSFGGRRLFCQTTYSDLDNVKDDYIYGSSSKSKANQSFDNLLKEFKEFKDQIKRQKV